jgi:hypothetical protein
MQAQHCECRRQGHEGDWPVVNEQVEVDPLPAQQL